MNRKDRRNEAMRQENERMRAKLLAAHDLLHNNKLNELHELLHCESCEEAAEALSGQNISIDAAGRLSRFVPAFNRLCATHRIDACCVAHLPSATKEGYVSIQMGGSVGVINWLRRQMGMKETLAVGDHDH